METHSKTPSLQQGFASCPRQPHPATHRTQLCYQLRLFKSLFFFVCFEGTRARSPGLPWQTPCQGLSWGRASAFPWTWARPHCPQGQEELSSFSHFHLPLTHYAQIPLSAARNSRLMNPWCNHRRAVPLGIIFSSLCSPVTDIFYFRQQQPPQAELEVGPGRESLAGYEHSQVGPEGFGHSLFVVLHCLSHHFAGGLKVVAPG